MKSPLCKATIIFAILNGQTLLPAATANISKSPETIPYALFSGQQDYNRETETVCNFSEPHPASGRQNIPAPLFHESPDATSETGYGLYSPQTCSHQNGELEHAICNFLKKAFHSLISLCHNFIHSWISFIPYLLELGGIY